MISLKTTTLSLVAAAAIALTGCGSSDTNSNSNSNSNSNPNSKASTCSSNFEVLPSIIKNDMTLDASKTYGMDGKVNVSNGAKLTIPAGTTIAGCTPKSFMVIEPGAKIIANGTQAKPIVFTSQKDVLGKSKANAAGEWGGLVLAGNAYTHYKDNAYEADESVKFGSTTHDHDSESSGSLKYVLIKHSGYEVEKDKELNGLSLAGVGSGTVLKNIAIIGGLDDGVEIWGGRANIDGLYVYNAHDDSVDTDLGYRGTIKNVLVQQVNVDNTNNHDSAGMEFGNDHNTIVTDDSNATQPIMINYTAYIKGGGISIKDDAGAKLTNVKFISAKTKDEQQVFYRSADVVDTHAMHVNGDLCFKDTAETLASDNTTYSDKNSKDSSPKTALYDWVTKPGIQMGASGSINVDSDVCAGVNEANIWKGKAGSNEPLETPAVNSKTAELVNAITTDTTLTADKVWMYSGKVNVKKGVTLTVEPGTTIAGKTPQSFIVIEPGAKLIAKGTMAKPIVFTSKKDVDGNSKDNTAGEWGGLVLAGNAYTHYKDNAYEADESVKFGSTTHDHDSESSGSLKYVLIKHSGYEVEKDKELNGLSLAGVGSGTVLKNIAIIGGLDDGVEIWGGRANIDGLYVYNAHDDSVDTDLGYRGTIKNVLVQQVNVDNTNNHDSAGMEFGNDHNTIVTDDSNATQPIMINYTAYIKGGGISIKDDAGAKLTNVKFISAKTKDEQQVFYRSADVVDTHAMHVNGDLCFKDSALTLANDKTTYSDKNSKDDSNKTALYDWVTNPGVQMGANGAIHLDDDTSCAGATEANIWKGKAGSMDPLEDYTK